MLAINYTTMRNNLKTYCDKATDYDETVIVTRKNEKNVYLYKIDSSIEQLKAGKGQRHELIEVDDE